MIKELIHQEDIAIINIHVSKIRALENIKQIVSNLKRETDYSYRRGSQYLTFNNA